MKYTPDDLLQFQSLSLDSKITMSLQRIKEWYEFYKGNVFVSFSGGKDSTCLLYLVRSIYPDVKAVFVDTGLEYPEIRDYVKSIDNVEIIRPKMNFKEVILKYGYPLPTKEYARKLHYAQEGKEWALKYVNADSKIDRYNMAKKWAKLLDAPFKISDHCCYVMKKSPMHIYSHKNKSYPFLGTLACESGLRKSAWFQTGCNAFDSKYPKSTPIAFWTGNDILTYLYTNKIKIASVYGDIVESGKWIENLDGSYTPMYMTTKCQRTGCMFCMFGCHLENHPNRFEIMKITHPKQYEYCMKPVNEGGLGLDEVLTYMDIKH